MVFSKGEFGRAEEVGPLIEPWAAKNGILTTTYWDEPAIALEMPPGEEKDGVARSLVDDIKAIASVLDALLPRPETGGEQE